MMKRCFLTGEYVFYATDRAKRPHSFKKQSVKTVPEQYCPFCLRNEYMTPGVIYATEDNSIRIVPNKYPFIDADNEFLAFTMFLLTQQTTMNLCPILVTIICLNLWKQCR